MSSALRQGAAALAAKETAWAAERAELDRQPVDYVSVAERAIAEIDYRHAAGDARSGYEKWKHILETLQRP